MKDKYFADLKDYRKYGLLRELATAGLRLGVCWMLTDRDDRPGGDDTSYWHNPKRWRRFDPELFDFLTRCRAHPEFRTVRMAREWNLIPNALFWEELLRDDVPSRKTYFEGALTALRETDLIFFDPDMGLEIPSKKFGLKGSSQHVFLDEVHRAFGSGHSVLIYQHYPRENRQAVWNRRAEQLAESLRRQSIRGFATAHVLFLLAAQPGHMAAVDRASYALLQRWASEFEQLILTTEIAIDRSRRPDVNVAVHESQPVPWRISGLTPDQITSLALQLEVTDRSRLAEQLLASLEGLTEAEITELWLAEAERRDAEMGKNPGSARSAEEVMRNARRMLRLSSAM